MVEAGDEEIGMAVVVVVADGDAHVVSGAGEAGGVGYVGEDAVAVVAEEAVAILGSVFLQRGDIRAVGEEDVGASVAVVVEDGNASGHGFRSVAGRRFGVLQAEGDFLQFEGDGAGGGGSLEQHQSAQDNQDREEVRQARLRCSRVPSAPGKSAGLWDDAL